METQKLIYMANQIGKFFDAQGEEAAVNGVEKHIRQFWDPRMRKEIVAFALAGGSGLNGAVQKAVLRLPEALTSAGPHPGCS